MSKLEIPAPRRFMPFLRPARYKGIFGGRGTGKSHFLAAMLIEECIALPSTRAVCVREVQRSLEQSVKKLLEDKIVAMGAESHFEVRASEIHVLDDSGARRGLIIFQGMRLVWRWRREARPGPSAPRGDGR